MLLGSYGMGIACETIGFQPFGTLAHPSASGINSVFFIKLVRNCTPPHLSDCIQFIYRKKGLLNPTLNLMNNLGTTGTCVGGPF